MPHAWFMEPTLRTLDVLSLESRRLVVTASYEGDVKVRAEPFNAIELDLGALWI